MKNSFTKEDKLNVIINENPLVLMAMSRFGISLGFGDKTVEAICKQQGVDCSTFLAIANFISFSTANIDDISLPSLMAYLDNAHEYFLGFCLPSIRRKLIEAIDCSGRNEIAMLILKFYDEYVEEVSKHMAYESREVFTYVRRLIDGNPNDEFNISVFAAHHHSIHDKLIELKDIIIRYLPQKDNNLLNSVLFDIINCEQDLVMHCKVEDVIFVPVVKQLESRISESKRNYQKIDDDQKNADSDEQISLRERDIIECVARGFSNKEIADRLNISINTVTTHRRNLAQKLQIHSPAGLTIYAVINGIVDINSLAESL